jgi:hypothetical protein
MIACVSPSDKFFEESTSTLNYATKASSICNAPTVNEDPKIKKIRELNEKVRNLQK